MKSKMAGGKKAKESLSDELIEFTARLCFERFRADLAHMQALFHFSGAGDGRHAGMLVSIARGLETLENDLMRARQAAAGLQALASRG